MGFILRFLSNWLGGMVAAAATVLVYVYLLGAPDLPRLPIIGLPEHYVALALIALWALVQLYLTILGAAVDLVLGIVAIRQAPGAKMAFFHGAASTLGLILLGLYYRPTVPSLSAVLLTPLAVHAVVRLAAGKLPQSK